MKVGLLVECGREGPEAVIIPRLIELLGSEYGADIEVVVRPMSDKRQLLTDCGIATKVLLDRGCERVVIVWDEVPSWPDKNLKPCWHNDRQTALANLEASGVSADKAFLVCIEREFESWLLCDDGMISRLLSRPTHPVRCPKQRSPDRDGSPKSTMMRLFKELAGASYVDVIYAKRIANEIQSLNKVKKCKTFKRFALKLADLEI